MTALLDRVLLGLALGTAAVAAAAERVTVRSDVCPVQAALSVVPGDREELSQLVLTLRIADPWYIYTKSSNNAVLEIELELPEGVEAVGDWAKPKPRAFYREERVEVYAGDQVLRKNVRTKVDATGAGKVVAKIRFQACDPTICRPPEEISVTATYPPKK
jgi:hypothetical protein